MGAAGTGAAQRINFPTGENEMIINVGIGPWTRRNFHHVPISMDFVSTQRWSNIPNVHNTHRQPYVRNILDEIVWTSINRSEDGVKVLIGRVRAGHMFPSGGFHYFTARLSIMYKHLPGAYELARKEMEAVLQYKFSEFCRRETLREIIQGFNRVYWQNMG